MADYFTALLSDYLGEDYPLITRSEFPALLTDDVRLHVLQSRAAAAEWAVSETHRPVRVAAAHVIATGHGLLVAATLTAPHHDPWHYLAVPHSLFDTVADRVHDDPPPGSPAAVDCRLNHDLSSMWQFEAALRRMLDDYPAFELELAGDQ